MALASDGHRSFASRVGITVAIVVFALLLILLLYFVFDVILLIFAAVLLAVFLHGMADALGRVLPLREGLRVMIVATALILILAGAVALLAPSVAEQARHLRADLPRSAQAAGEYISRFGWGQALI